MPPKGSSTKRAAAPEEGENGSGNGTTSELRRSTRGGGHKAPEPKPVKPRSASGSGPNKKAKKDADDAKVVEATAGEDTKDAGEQDAPPSVDAKAEAEKHTDAAGEATASKEATNGASTDDVPQETKEAEKEVTKSSSSGRIEVGQQIPEGLVLKNEADEDVTISELTKDKGAVFFVYPKANTPGCTNQACDFRDHYAEFGPLGYDDSPKSQSSWKTKHNFPYHLLCDPGFALTKILGAAKSAQKTNQRSHFIVEKGGKLVDAKYTISPKDSCTKALEFIKAHQGGEN